jgi:hypothetical protein
VLALQNKLERVSPLLFSGRVCEELTLFLNIFYKSAMEPFNNEGVCFFGFFSGRF